MVRQKVLKIEYEVPNIKFLYNNKIIENPPHYCRQNCIKYLFFILSIIKKILENSKNDL